jgi:peptidoglycan hydrolase-like protein with peptidoglycan-binding domain
MGIGPDVASVDENGIRPDWATSVSDGHATFAICRGMEALTPDPDWKAYRAELKALGVPVSAYLFLHFPKGGAKVPDPEVQVDAFVDFVGIDRTNAPPALDLEQRRAQSPGSTTEDWFIWAHRAWKRLRDRIGAAPTVYTSAEWWSDPDGMNGHAAPEMAASPGWFKFTPYPIGAPAVYDLAIVNALPPPACPTPWRGQWLTQQYQLDAKGYPGLKSTCDLNRFCVLRQGDHNPTVAWMQARLGGITVDGVFGPATEAALKNFQSAHGLWADGVYGPKSHGFLAWH